MYEQIAANRRRTVVLLAAFFILVVALGVAFDVLVGFGGVAVGAAVAIAIAMSIGSYFWSDRIALAMSHARPADPVEHRRLHNLVDGLCIGAGLPKPRLYVIDDAAPNAFATGRDPEHSAVAVTTGLLDKMDRIELEGVLAHELSHVKNRDILVTTISVVLVGVVALLADWSLRFFFWGGPRHRNDSSEGRGPAAILGILGFVLIIFAPLIARLMHFAVSRRRESLADFSAVKITRYPPGLVSALEKLRDDTSVVHSASRATAHLWIESPLERKRARGAWLNRLFDTHPPLEERIEALKEL
ncbi:MAG: M48 family metallopeptidase [Actinobacteria bacterium]|nr:M48 family metallopeptidase [Actinomycetota bacterium]